MADFVTGIGIMSSATTLQTGRMRKEQQTADAAARRLDGSFDAYSSHASSAGVGLEAEAQASQYKSELASAQSMLLRQRQMDSQISRASAISNDLRVFLQSLRGGVSQLDLGAVNARINSTANVFVSVLNENLGGHYVLGGDKSQAPCVDLSVATTPLSSGSPVTYDYYVGGNKSGSVVMGGVPVEQFPITANDPAFASTLTALRLMMDSALTNSPNDPLIVEALQMLDNSKTSYSAAISTSAINTRNVQEVHDKLQTMVSSVQDTVKSALGTVEYDDIIAQMTAMHNLRVQESLIEARIDSIRTMLNRMR